MSSSLCLWVSLNIIPRVAFLERNWLNAAITLIPKCYFVLSPYFFCCSSHYICDLSPSCYVWYRYFFWIFFQGNVTSWYIIEGTTIDWLNLTGNSYFHQGLLLWQREKSTWTKEELKTRWAQTGSLSLRQNTGTNLGMEDALTQWIWLKKKWRKADLNSCPKKIN